MNILFVLYGDFTSNSANPLVLYARELRSRGHTCAIAVPANLESISLHEKPAFVPILYRDALASPDSIFCDGRPADVIHACTPREVVRRFVTSYMKRRPTPLVIYLEDNESWLSTRELGLDQATLAGALENEIASKLPEALSHPFRYDCFIGLADAVAVIQDKLKIEVPPWVRCETVMLGVDLEFFSPRPPKISSRKKYGIADGERVIVYHGGVDQFKSRAIESLCKAVELINRKGIPCRLLRTGIRPLTFLDEWPRETVSVINDLGMLPRSELPDLLSSADVFVQPGQIDPFEDLRLPGKVPEFLAMGRPVIMPDANIAPLFRDGVDVLLLRTGDADEIASKCIELFADAKRAAEMGRAGRVLAEKYFDVRSQAGLLEGVYKSAVRNFDRTIASKVWTSAHEDEPVAFTLARKLKSLGELHGMELGLDAGGLLRQHARRLELMQRRVIALERGIGERDSQITNLNQAIAERDGQIVGLKREIESFLSSKSWRITQPLRFAGRLARRGRDFLTTFSLRDVLGSFARHSRLAAHARFARYCVNRGRDWYLRRGRLPGIRELSGLLRRTLFEYQIRCRPGSGDLSLPRGFKLPQRLDSYAAWIMVNQRTKQFGERLRDRLNRGAARLPKISVVMPVYNPPQEFFELAVASVRNQIYENWELCIAEDASSVAWIRQRLQELANEDPRIRVCFREKNGNISLASNSAAQLAAGDFLAFLDQDDLLTSDALAEVALCLAEHDTVDVLYSDDDKIDAEGNRFAPQFKPDWSPELLLSYMYLSHLFVVRKTLFQQVNGFRPGFEGSQDYDLALRVIERARNVAHLPYVLYHWRVLPGSTAARGDAKPASFKAGCRAITEALTRRGVKSKVFRPDWAIKGATGIFWHDFPDDGPSVTIIIPTKNQKAALERCLDSLQMTTYHDFQTVIIDNGSDDRDTVRYLESLKSRVLKIQNPTGNFNFAYINNRAVEEVDSDYVLFLNNDTEVRDPKWLSRMVGYAGLSGVGAVGARLIYPDGRVQHAGIVHGYYDGMAGPALKLLPSWHHGYLSYAMVTRNCSAVTAACMLTRRSLFLEHGGFNERQFAVAYNDVDYCYRLMDQGLRCVYAPGAELYHHEGLSRGFGDNPEELAAFRRKYSGRTDPYYNPNLSLLNEQFEISPRRLVRHPSKRPIRALMCSCNLNLEGAAYSQYELTLELARAKQIDAVVYSPVDGPLRCSYERAGIKVIVRRHPLESIFESAAYERVMNGFSDWIKQTGVELVYGNTLQTFYAIDAAKRGGLPSVWNVRESEPWQSYFNYLSRPLVLKALSCFSYPYRVVFVSHATRNGFESLNSTRNFCVIQNGLDMLRLEKMRDEWPTPKSRSKLGLSENEIMVLVLGTVCVRKGQKDLVQAMSVLKNSAATKVHLFIVGDRPSLYSSEMNKMVASLPGERAARISIVPETEKTALYYSAADIFVCTSRVESYPRVILEAMAYGLPIISTPVFGTLEQVREQVNGEFYESGNVAQLASKIENLILDQSKRDLYRRNAPFVLESLPGFDEMVRRYAEVFNESAAT